MAWFRGALNHEMKVPRGGSATKFTDQIESRADSASSGRPPRTRAWGLVVLSHALVPNKSKSLPSYIFERPGTIDGKCGCESTRSTPTKSRLLSATATTSIAHGRMASVCESSVDRCHHARNDSLDRRS
jgi:hypothetical protein